MRIRQSVILNSQFSTLNSQLSTLKEMKNLYNTIAETLTAPEATAAYRKAGVPAVLFEFNISHSSAAQATANITLHLCYEQAQDSSSISSSKDSTLKFFDFTEVTTQLLEGLESQNTGKLELTGEEMVKDDAIVNVYTLSYNCRYKRKAKEGRYKYVTGEKLTADQGIRESGIS